MGPARPRLSRPAAALVALTLGLSTCSGLGAGPNADEAEMVRLLLAGDVMLGRGVAPMALRDPGGVFEGVRALLAAADLAAANLESPLTRAAHVDPGGFSLEADPAAARVLALAGFDLAALANNHAGDAGPGSVLDTIEALAQVGVVAVGGGVDREAAEAPVTVTSGGVTVTFLAFDLTGQGPAAGPGLPGVAAWEEEAAEAAVRAAASTEGVVVVSIHGGVEGAPEADPVTADLAGRLAGWGADVVWGHGPHVLQPVETRAGAVVATSLGNLLFDQRSDSGGLLEVLADRAGVVAFRVTETSDRRGVVAVERRHPPTGQAVLLDGAWWELVRPVSAPAGRPSSDLGFRWGELEAAGVGDLSGDGSPEVVAAFRRPARETPIHRYWPAHAWVDEAGRTAHLGVYAEEGLEPVWVAGALARPVNRLAVCDGAIAVTYGGLDDPATVAAGGWTWTGFGFRLAPDLGGPGTPGCADVDGDGRRDPVITGR